MNWQLTIALFSILVSLHANAQDFELRRPPPPTNASPEILGGQKAIPENWPATFVFIAATVIGPKVVLTAAHCIAKGPSGGFEGSSVNLTYTPHFYYGGESGHDIALCRASSDIRLKNDAPYETLSVFLRFCETIESRCNPVPMGPGLSLRVRRDSQYPATFRT